MLTKIYLYFVLEFHGINYFLCEALKYVSQRLEYSFTNFGDMAPLSNWGPPLSPLSNRGPPLSPLSPRE